MGMTMNELIYDYMRYGLESDPIGLYIDYGDMEYQSKELEKTIGFHTYVRGREMYLLRLELYKSITPLMLPIIKFLIKAISEAKKIDQWLRKVK